MKFHPNAGWWLGVVALALPSALLAVQSDPLDAEAAVPAQVYQSPLNDYRGQRYEALQDWRAANEEVGRIGGWRTYSMEGWEQPAEQGVEPAVGGGHEHH